MRRTVFLVASFLRHVMLQGRQSWHGLETTRAWHSCLRLWDSCWNWKQPEVRFDSITQLMDTIRLTTWYIYIYLYYIGTLSLMIYVNNFTKIHTSFRWCMILSITSSLYWYLCMSQKRGILQISTKWLLMSLEKALVALQGQGGGVR